MCWAWGAQSRCLRAGPERQWPEPRTHTVPCAFYYSFLSLLKKQQQKTKKRKICSLKHFIILIAFLWMLVLFSICARLLTISLSSVKGLCMSFHCICAGHCFSFIDLYEAFIRDISLCHIVRISVPLCYSTFYSIYSAF